MPLLAEPVNFTEDFFGMAKLQLVIELDFDDKIYGAFSDDESERDWFYNHLLGDELILHSNLVGDAVGSVTVVNIIDG